MPSCSPFTWLLDAIIIVTIVFNLSALARLQRAQRRTDELILKLKARAEELRQAREALVGYYKIADGPR